MMDQGFVSSVPTPSPGASFTVAAPPDRRVSRPSGPLADLYAPIFDDLLSAQHIFDRELISDLPFVNELCATIRTYRGKMLRPALLLLAAKACGGVSKSHHTLAAVIEMVHVATLVHDDVLDEADERRRQPTVGAMAGNTAAVLVGDYLISHAFHLCSILDDHYALRRIGQTTNTVCEGELLQNVQRVRCDLTEGEYFDINQRKTGALTATACELGAKLAGADDATVDALSDYGLWCGVAFQIVDDVLDIVGDEKQIGKTLGRDFSLGKLTLPTIHCLANAAPETVAALRDALTASDPCGPRRLREWLAETDSIEYARSAARAYVADAVRQLDILPPSDAKTSLVALTEFVVRRRF